MSLDNYQRMQETMALLKVLALGERQLKAGKVTDTKSVINKIRR
jgi:hypothetical protein